MEKKTLKLTAVAAGAVVLAGAAFAAPSFASAKHHSVKAASSSSTGTNGTAPTWGGKSGDAVDGTFKGGIPADRVESTVAATITGVPSTVTDLEVAEHSALFFAYEYTGTAPTTQPTTGGHPARFEATALANGTVTGTLGFLSPKTAGTYNVAVYTSSTDATPDLVTITVDSAGKATATSATALTAAYDATAAAKGPGFGGPGFGPGKDGKGPKGDHGPRGPRGGHGDHDGDKGGANGGSGWTPPTTATPAPTN
jgi:hypothetical protein